MTTNAKPNLPSISDLFSLCKAVKAGIEDDYRATADTEDDAPGTQLTVGIDTTGADQHDWGYQTGDNSYTGGAYSYPDWAVVEIYRDSNCRDLARELRDQLAELFWSR